MPVKFLLFYFLMSFSLFLKKLYKTIKGYNFLTKILPVFYLLISLNAQAAAYIPIKIFASQNSTGQLAKEIGGDDVLVTEAKGETKDPHHFEITVDEKKALTEADIVILNGLGYESWARGIIKKTENFTNNHFNSKKINNRVNKQKVIVIADLLDKKPKDDPHIWYDPKAFPLLAKQLFMEISKIAPKNEKIYKENLKKVLHRYQYLNTLVNKIRKKYAGTAIGATEPVFSYMADHLKLNMLHKNFQRMIMNHSEPSISQISAFQQDLQTRKIKILIENSQTHTPFTKHFVQIAKKNKIPIVTVSETLPLNISNHAEWMIKQLYSLEKALHTYLKSN